MKKPIETLWQELRSLTSIEHLESPPTPLEFHRNYVSQSKPCLISNAISHWPALSLWPSPSYLSHTLSSTPVSLHLTPNGRADSLAPIPETPPPLVSQKPCYPGKPDKPGVLVTSPKMDPLETPHQSQFINDTAPNPYRSGIPGQSAVTESITDSRNSDQIVWSEDLEEAGLTRNALEHENLVSNGVDMDDPPAQLCFASACVAKVPFDEAILRVSNSGRQGPVAYLQQQNDCFREEYGALSGDCDGDIEWASEAFGCLPEAVNLWIGNELSETSWHKDHYENIYAVVSGEKRFLLLPPTDVHRMYVKEYPAANYVYDEDTREFKLDLEEPKRYVPWCSVDPYPSPETKARDAARFPLYFYGLKPFEVTVRAGEILYLPSMWFHYVRQGADDHGRTIAINYWYDMQFDIKYAYFNFLSSIPYQILDGNRHPQLEDEHSDSDSCSGEINCALFDG